ncbi:MAG: GGDEF domain-containing protein, partial [Lysobacter sp.]
MPRLFAKLGPSRAFHSLSAAERRALTEAQVAATRPIISGVILSGALILAMTGMFEAIGAAPGIGYPWWVIELVAAAIAGCGLAIWNIDDWRPRLALTLLSTILLGVFLSIPTPGESGQLAIRTGLFQLLPIALLALLARPLSVVCLVVVMVGLAYVRIAMHGAPSTGAALYWLYTTTTVGFGLLMGRYLSDYAVSAYRLRRRMRQQTITDELTGLLNRAGWNRDAADAYAVAMTRGVPLSFAFFDIDYFKRVNDTFGHEAGDQVLQMLGRILAERA